MQKFSFKQEKDLLIPETKNMVYPKDSKGNVLSGEEFVKKMAIIAKTWEDKFKRPVPIQDQKFVAWLLQTKNSMDNGKSFETILKETVVF